MKFTKQQYEELVLVMESESEFYRSYTRNIQRTFGQRRELINRWLWHCRSHYPKWATTADVEDRDQLRRYFDTRYSLPQEEENVYAYIPSVWEACPSFAPTPTPTPTPLENTVPQVIEVTTQTLVNGKDVKGMSDSQIYELIREQEATIKDLEKIEAKPKKLTTEIAKRKAGIAALVAHLDAQPA